MDDPSAYRLIDRMGLNEGACNHLTGQMLQMRGDCFLAIFLSQENNHNTVILHLRQKKWPKSILTSSAASDLIAPLRMMHLKSLGETLEDLWKPLWKLPDHEEERYKVARSDWDMIQVEVVEFLRSRCFLK